MDYRVDLGNIASIQVVPGIGLGDTRFLGSNDVKAVYRVDLVLRQVSDKVRTHEPVDSGYEDGHGKIT